MNVHPLAIVLGTITDLVLSFTICPLELYLMGINERSPYLYPASLTFGLIAIAIGGYVTAWRSQSSKIFNTIIFAGIQLLIGAFAAATITMPVWFNIASFILIVPASLLGAYATLPSNDY